MRRFMVAGVVLVLVLGAAWAGDDPEPPARGGQIVGEWKLIEIKLKGVALPFPNEARLTFEFKKDGSLAMEGQGENKKGKWKVNASKSPRHLDLDDGSKTSLLIYKVEKDVLTLAGDEGQGNKRPKDFTSAEVTMVLKRMAKK